MTSGVFLSRTPGSDWTFRKWVNLVLRSKAPPYLHICNPAFLGHRLGGVNVRANHAWFEGNQPCSPALLPDLAREIVHPGQNLRCAPQKILALDLDNTLRGGVIADEGLEGI